MGLQSARWPEGSHPPFLAPRPAIALPARPTGSARKIEETRRTKGIIHDESIRQRCLNEVKTFALEALPNAQLIGDMDCPITGGDGNREFLLGLRKGGQ